MTGGVPISFEHLSNLDADRRPALHALLRTILITHFDITRELTAAPPPIDADPLSRIRDKVSAQHIRKTTSNTTQIEHIRLTGINMHHIINELRPIQVSIVFSASQHIDTFCRPERLSHTCSSSSRTGVKPKPRKSKQSIKK